MRWTYKMDTSLAVQTLNPYVIFITELVLISKKQLHAEIGAMQISELVRNLALQVV